MGDFNMDLLKVEDCKITEEFVNTLASFNFSPHILQPTRITEHTATLIDIIIHSKYFLVSDWLKPHA